MNVEQTLVPSSDAMAIVRHASPPADPPDELVPFVVPDQVDGQLADWHLTDDVLAFGDHSVPARFSAWRSEWERWWLLDPAPSIERLHSAACELLAPHLRAALDPIASSGCELVVAVADHAALTAAVAAVQDAVRERGAFGYGFVDATEGSGRTGLARAWSPQDGPEVLARDDHLVASMHPATGLSVALTGDDGDAVVVDGVEEVDLLGRVVSITAAGETWSLPGEAARPLGWLVPGAGRYRVRRVPEVVVWARTCVGLDEACRYGTALGLPVRLTASSRVART